MLYNTMQERLAIRKKYLLTLFESNVFCFLHEKLFLSLGLPKGICLRGEFRKVFIEWLLINNAILAEWQPDVLHCMRYFCFSRKEEKSNFILNLEKKNWKQRNPFTSSLKNYFVCCFHHKLYLCSIF